VAPEPVAAPAEPEPAAPVVGAAEPEPAAPVAVPSEPADVAAKAVPLEPVVAPAPRITPAPVAPAQRPVAAPLRSVRFDPRGIARFSGRTHRVRAGESLWSIAERLLGAAAASAHVAAEVDRLWRLNEAHIATGDPDLLPAGITIVVARS
jgi:nucleoid-associated protein YgaU